MAQNGTKSSAFMIASSDRRADWIDGLLVVLLSAAVFAIAHRHAFFSAYVINDDIRQQLFWMARWLDPTLYPPDLLSDYAAVYVPDGVKTLYFLAAKGCGCDPILFSKLLTGVLFVLLAVTMYGIGRTLGDRSLGFACAAMIWLMPFFLKNISGGLSRAFAAPFLALFVLAWLKGRGGAMALVLILQALCIPYMAVLCAGCACLESGLRLLRHRRLGTFPGRVWHFAALLLAAFLVWRMQHAFLAAGFGPLVTGQALATGPEYGPAGRLDLYPQPNPFFDLVYWPFESIGLFLECGLAAGILSLAALLPVLIRGARRAPWPAIWRKSHPLAFLLAGSLVLYTVARIVALTLFVPDRYSSYTINLLYALGLAICLRFAVVSRFEHRKLAGACLLLAAAGLGAWRLTDASLYDYRNGSALYAAVARLPKDALLAGNPNVLDNVLTFGRRTVLASYELAHPWSLGYWKRYAPRLADQAAAYYAKDPATVLTIARKHGLTHLVVRESDFTPKALAGSPVFEPFDARIRELAAKPGPFVLLADKLFPSERIAPGFRLIDLRPLLAAGAQ